VSLEQIFDVSQIISSAAVVGSLIYLGLQVRYAERSQRGLMQQARADRTSKGSMTVAHPELARIWMKGAAGDGDLSPVECTQWLLLTRALFLSGEDTVLQYKAGLMTKETYDTYVAAVRFYLAQPGFRAAWKMQRMTFGLVFRSFVDAILQEIPVAPAADALSEWNALVRAERATQPQA
jgi:hypothetical protein